MHRRHAQPRRLMQRNGHVRGRRLAELHPLHVRRRGMQDLVRIQFGLRGELPLRHGKRRLQEGERPELLERDGMLHELLHGRRVLQRPVLGNLREVQHGRQQGFLRAGRRRGGSRRGMSGRRRPVLRPQRAVQRAEVLLLLRGRD
jgi:hypothetical protein